MKNKTEEGKQETAQKMSLKRNDGAIKMKGNEEIKLYIDQQTNDGTNVKKCKTKFKLKTNQPKK